MTANTRIGTEVAGFRLESLLGRGGMSVVYVAEQLRLSRKVALKLLTTELGWDDQFRERFVRESQIAAAIDHPNIIPIYDAGEADGLLYIAMRFVAGPDLKEVLKRDGILGVGRTIFILEQVASALDAAHAHALVHRDVKPGNILLEESTDHAYLTDFGVAKQTTARGLTSTGHFLGTVEYAAPEQIEGKPVDARTDVYALGCVLYECLTGSPPFAHGTEHAVLHAHLVDPPPSVTRVRPELPHAFDGVIATAMAKASADRFHSCGELAAARATSALLVAFAAAVSGGVVYLVTKNDNSSTTPTTTLAGGAHPLEQLVPSPVWQTCKLQSQPRAGAVQTAVCVRPAGSTVFAPDRLVVSSYPSGAAVQQAYEAERRLHHVPRNEGRCNGLSWGGEGSWLHNPAAPGAAPKPGGSRLCYFDGNDAVIVWTHRKFGQATHTDILGIAREGGSDHPGLYSWWRFWHHRIGKVV